MSAILQFPSPRADEWASPAECAKILKQSLKRRFPSTKFSVTLDRGTAYGCCNVSWTDGPTVKLLDEIVSPFEGEGFDGMTDSSIHYHVNLPDGRRCRLRIISTNRHISPEFARKCAAQVAAFYGLPLPEITEYESGYWKLEHDSAWVREDIREFWSTLIYQAASDHSRYAKLAL